MILLDPSTFLAFNIDQHCWKACPKINKGAKLKRDV